MGTKNNYVGFIWPCLCSLKRSCCYVDVAVPLVGDADMSLTDGCVAQLAERRSLAGELTVLRSACSRRVTTMWVNRPLQVSHTGQLSLSSSRSR